MYSGLRNASGRTIRNNLVQLAHDITGHHIFMGVLGRANSSISQRRCLPGQVSNYCYGGRRPGGANNVLTPPHTPETRGATHAIKAAV